eukprot:366119-Chlamydomonas_euryale.AAC.18
MASWGWHPLMHRIDFNAVETRCYTAHVSEAVHTFGPELSTLARIPVNSFPPIPTNLNGKKEGRWGQCCAPGTGRCWHMHVLTVGPTGSGAEACCGQQGACLTCAAATVCGGCRCRSGSAPLPATATGSPPAQRQITLGTASPPPECRCRRTRSRQRRPGRGPWPHYTQSGHTASPHGSCPLGARPHLRPATRQHLFGSRLVRCQDGMACSPRSALGLDGQCRRRCTM